MPTYANLSIPFQGQLFLIYLDTDNETYVVALDTGNPPVFISTQDMIAQMIAWSE